MFSCLQHCGIFWLFFSFFAVLPRQASTQANPVELYELSRQYAESFRYDSVMILTNRALTQLAAEGATNDRLQLQLTFLQLEVLERRSEFSPVVKQLLQLIETCNDKGFPDIAIDAHLLLALIQEKLKRPDECLQQLDQASRLSKQFAIDSLMGHIAVRRSSYHRFFGDQDSLLYYANQAVATGHTPNVLADGHFLRSYYLKKHGQAEQAAVELRKMADIHFKNHNYDGYSWYFANLTIDAIKKEDITTAMFYNDSSLYYNQLAENEGMFRPGAADYFYSTRANLFELLGQPDSSIYYLKLSKVAAVEASKQRSQDRVAAIEVQYQLQQSTDQLAQKQMELERANGLANIRNIILVIGTFLVWILLYLIKSLRTKREELEDRGRELGTLNEALRSSLDTQLMLQGEIHHRVKNNLQIIISLLELQAEELEDPNAQERLSAMAGRIYSMAAIHEILHHSTGEDLVSLVLYVEKLCEQFEMTVGGRNDIQILHEIDPIELNLETLMPIGIILNELMNNTYKYGMSEQEVYEITITGTRNHDQYIIQYQDTGQGYPSGELENEPGSLGNYLLNSMSRQISGKLITFNADGAITRLVFPLEFTN